MGIRQKRKFHNYHIFCEFVIYDTDVSSFSPPRYKTHVPITDPYTQRLSPETDPRTEIFFPSFRTFPGTQHPPTMYDPEGVSQSNRDRDFFPYKNIPTWVESLGSMFPYHLGELLRSHPPNPQCIVDGFEPTTLALVRHDRYPPR